MVNFIKVNKIRAYVKKQHRRVGKDYLQLLDARVQGFLDKSCETFNGSKVTLDKHVAIYSGVVKEAGK